MRHQMAILAFILLACGSALAFSVRPSFIEIQDTGNDNLPKLDVVITVDCDTKQAGVEVASNETGDAVEGATAYLFYTDYTYQPLPNPGKTDSSGKATIPVPGTLRFLKAMFTLRVDAQGFQSREIEFTYAKCFEPQPAEPDEPADGSDADGMDTTPPEDTGPQQNTTTPPANATPPADTAPQTPPEQPGGNDTGAPQPGAQDAPGAPACPAAAGLVLLSLLIAKTRG